MDESGGDVTTAWVFPGQGAQAVGMGKALAESDSGAQARFAEADETLGFALSRTIWEGPEDVLAQTDVQQPAILVVSIVHFEVLQRRGLLPVAAYAAGHSLGQYAAAVATGALPFANAVRLVRRRGEAMQAHGRGAMAAVLGMDADAVRAIADETGAELANVNAPGQVTIAGRMDAVERAASLTKEHGARRVMMLPVSAAFHTSLMRPVVDELSPLLDAAPFSDPAVPIVSNVDARLLRTADDLRAELRGHVTASVQWVRTIETLRDAGVTDYIEIGPGNILAGLIKRIDKDARSQTSDALLAAL